MASSNPQSVALVTGVSREGCIGLAVVRRLRADGYTVVASGWPPHDDDQPWPIEALVDERVRRHDLGVPETPAALVDEVVDEFGRLDIVVAAHAQSTGNGLADVTADELDRAWAVNVRSIVLLAQRWVAHRASADMASGRLVFFTSGQHLEPMDGELAYAISKGALHQLALSLDHAVSSAGIIANCINPGPVDTGYADGEVHAAVAEMFDDGRWTMPNETAELVAFLVSDRGSLFRGQVLDAENGFRR